jgi:hypothetical protein
MKNITLTDDEFSLILTALSFMYKFTSDESDLICELDLTSNAVNRVNKLNQDLEDLSVKLCINKV